MIRDKKQFAAMLRAMRAEFRPMPADKYREAIAAVGLTQEAAGPFFGWRARTAQSWASGAAPVPWEVQWALEFMVTNGLQSKDVKTP